MKTLYLDCSMGAAGDMLTAALLELLDNPETALNTLNRAFCGKAVLSVQRDQKCGISGNHVTVTIGDRVESEGYHPHGQEHHRHTSITEVRTFLSGLDLPDPVIADALTVYDLIAAAESRVHDCEMENIHFHEVGSLDAMADVVSVCFLMHLLSPEKVCASPVHVGSGTVTCEHGELPVPAPATLELLKGIPIYTGDIRGELCTPTGAALLKHFVTSFGSMPVLRVSRIGYGTGFKDFPRPNVVRAVLGESEENREQIIELACNIDDMTAEELAFAQERLFAAGALDAYFIRIDMKKSRPGVMLVCLCRAEQRDGLLACMFHHTTSLGIREAVFNRHCLSRETEPRETPYGAVRVKRSYGYGTFHEKAEYEDLKKIAVEQDLSLREVQNMLL